MSYNEEEDNDVDEDEEAAPRPPAAENAAAPDNDDDDGEPPAVGNDDGDDDNMEAQADAQPSAEVEQQPGNLPGEIAGTGVVDQDEECDKPVFPEIPGVSEETPGVGAAEEDKGSENGDDLPTQDVVTGQLPPAPPGEDDSTGGRYNLRSDQNQNYNHRYAGKDFVVDDESGIVMTTEGSGEVLETPQMSLKAGLHTFGSDGVKAVEKEMRQLYDQGVMTPVHKKCLTPDQWKEALAYLMFLKRKRCGKIKGRGCADGQKQRAYIAKEESMAPMVSTEVVFLTAVIDALENRDVTVLDVPGAFMQADIDELVHVRFTGGKVNMLLQIDKEMYEDYVVMEKGEQVMYMELLKALYGTLRAAHLFWQKLSKQLIDVWGFVPNKYDDCVVNKTINGHQMTVVWHVDDLKVSHMDAKEVGKFIQQMEETFGKDTPLSVSHGRTHNYLGMTLDFRNQGEV